MALLGFSPRMAPLVESLVKCQTIRNFRRDGRDPQQDEALQLYVGLRQPGARKLVTPDPRCTIAAYVTIADRRGRRIGGSPACSVLAAWPRHRSTIDGDLRLWRDDELNAFARADGFRDFDDMLAWFCPKGGSFEGTLTAWLPPIEAIRRWKVAA